MLLLLSVAFAGKATPEEACARLVELRSKAYDTKVEPAMVEACVASLAKSTASKGDLKKALTCARDAPGHLQLWDCGMPIETALHASHPFEATFQAACKHQGKLAEGMVTDPLLAKSEEQLFVDCMNAIHLQDQVREPYDVAKKTRCMASAPDHAWSVNCWRD